MKLRALLIVTLGLLVVSPTGAGDGFAVVELFTSEGCSSCPPADRLLAEIVADAQQSGRPVFCLAFHVDYWDRLGWADGFADPAFSARQRSYGEALGEARIYTPQAVVNGAVGMVGSDRPRLERAIEQALEAPRSAALSLEIVEAVEGKPIAVKLTVEDAPEQSLLRIAVVERDLASSVARGENAGRTLRHTNVVRAFTTVDATDGRIKVQIDIPRGLDLSASSMIAFLQDPRTMHILAADQKTPR